MHLQYQYKILKKSIVQPFMPWTGQRWESDNKSLEDECEGCLGGTAATAMPPLCLSPLMPLAAAAHIRIGSLRTRNRIRGVIFYSVYWIWASRPTAQSYFQINGEFMQDEGSTKLTWTLQRNFRINFSTSVSSLK